MITQRIILIVDDERPLREALRDVLQRSGFQPLEAKNGKEGVEIALTKHPDLILLDLVMPEMGGMEALAKIRQDQWGARVPVIILTNLSANNEQLVEGVVTHQPINYLVKSDWKIHSILELVEGVFLQ
jgi:DNA-binding response OmpR family regulator